MPYLTNQWWLTNISQNKRRDLDTTVCLDIALLLGWLDFIGFAYDNVFITSRDSESRNGVYSF